MTVSSHTRHIHMFRVFGRTDTSSEWLSNFIHFFFNSSYDCVITRELLMDFHGHHLAFRIIYARVVATYEGSCR